MAMIVQVREEEKEGWGCVGREREERCGELEGRESGQGERCDLQVVARMKLCLRKIRLPRLLGKSS